MRIEQKWLNFHVSMTNSVAETRVTKIKINKNTNLGGTWTGGHAMRVALTASFCIILVHLGPESRVGHRGWVLARKAESGEGGLEKKIPKSGKFEFATFPRATPLSHRVSPRQGKINKLFSAQSLTTSQDEIDKLFSQQTDFYFYVTLPSRRSHMLK